jgi:hypothetical protein
MLNIIYKANNKILLTRVGLDSVITYEIRKQLMLSAPHSFTANMLHLRVTLPTQHLYYRKSV